MQRLALVLGTVLVFVSGCGTMTGGGGDGGGGSTDMAMGGGGGDSGGGGNQDFAGGGGGDQASSASIEVAWGLVDKKIQGQMGGFPVRCDDANVGFTTLTFVAVNAGTKARKETKGVACPKGAGGGSAIVELPDNTNGPFNLTAIADGKPMAKAFWVCGAEKTSSVRITIFALGCDDALCSGCP